jgi:hypothetical protein
MIKKADRRIGTAGFGENLCPLSGRMHTPVLLSNFAVDHCFVGESRECSDDFRIGT